MLASRKDDFAKLSVDELWTLYESVSQVLAHRIIAEKQELDAKLAVLNQRFQRREVTRQFQQKRRYPKVLQKYRNPNDQNQTWSGRGKQPHWVAKLLKAGAKLENLLIPEYTNVSPKAA